MTLVVISPRQLHPGNGSTSYIHPDVAAEVAVAVVVVVVVVVVVGVVVVVVSKLKVAASAADPLVNTTAKTKTTEKTKPKIDASLQTSSRSTLCRVRGSWRSRRCSTASSAEAEPRRHRR